METVKANNFVRLDETVVADEIESLRTYLDTLEQNLLDSKVDITADTPRRLIQCGRRLARWSNIRRRAQNKAKAGD